MGKEYNYVLINSVEDYKSATEDGVLHPYFSNPEDKVYPIIFKLRSSDGRIISHQSKRNSLLYTKFAPWVNEAKEYTDTLLDFDL